ncbi:putative bifunctional diguanylate cyclase/phosphodiesterase [Rheinheimera sp. NSM]|uniref:putative bifunctional diguanylate cyclase/phosphodiesterase n=1 Tax=Rheinheimera sp. NSM TaxID=3457884 RepID=UPI00403657A1
MPLHCWLLLSALLPAMPAFANQEAGTGWQNGIAIAVLLLLIVVLTLYNSKLRRRHNDMLAKHSVLQGFLQQSDDLIAIVTEDLSPGYLNPAFSALLADKHRAPSAPLALYLSAHGEQLLLPDVNQLSNWQGEAWLDAGEHRPRIALSLSVTATTQPPACYLLVGRNISRLKQQQQELTHRIVHDAETGLLSPLLLEDYLQTLLSSCNSKQPQCALLLIKFNQLLAADSQQHVLLQNVISKISGALLQQIPQGCVAARYSQDTLAVLLPPQLCDGQVEINLNRLAHKLLGLTTGLDEPAVKASLQTLIGISVYPLDGHTPAALLAEAERALTGAAKLGSDALLFANTRIQQRAPEYQSLETELQKALLQGEFDVHYQPRLSIGSNRVVGYEALLRWHSPKRGVLSPASFLNVADETGLLIALDRLTFRKCCEQLQYWQQTGINRGRISVNIASQSFRQADFVATLSNQLSVTGLSAEQFELELHEDIFLQPDTNIHNTLKQLTTLGFHLTLDNFGQGVSSLSVLRQYPLHSIKIAPGFIKDMEHNEQQRNITASLIRLASYLQLDVIATGIENEMQAYLLHVMGCDILQGHLFSKALPAAEIPALLAKENKLVRKEVS